MEATGHGKAGGFTGTDIKFLDCWNCSDDNTNTSSNTSSNTSWSCDVNFGVQQSLLWSTMIFQTALVWPLQDVGFQVRKTFGGLQKGKQFKV